MNGAALYRLVAWLAENGHTAAEVAACVAAVRRDDHAPSMSAQISAGYAWIAEAETGIGVVLPLVRDQ